MVPTMVAKYDMFICSVLCPHTAVLVNFIVQKTALNHFLPFCVIPADLLVWSKAAFITPNPSEVSSQTLTSAARHAEGSLTTGPRVMLSASILLLQPPLS